MPFYSGEISYEQMIKAELIQVIKCLERRTEYFEEQFNELEEENKRSIEKIYQTIGKKKKRKEYSNYYHI